MKILVVTQYFWPENFRGNDLTAQLVEKGHAVTVLTGIPNYPHGKFYPGYGFFKNTRQNYYGVKVVRVPLIPRGNGGKLNLIINYFSFIFFGTLLGPFVCREKFDIIFVQGLSPILMAIPAIFLKKIKKIPLVLWVLDLWPESIAAVGAFKSPFVLSSVTRIVKFIYSQCDRILVSSEGFINRIKSLGIEDKKISYWPQWAEEYYQMVTVDKDAPEALAMPKGFRVMFAGNIGAAQGFETIIKAADKLKENSDIQWVILGDGSFKPWVEQQIKLLKLEDRVHLLGRFPPEKMSYFFAQANVLLVSLKREPIFALTLPAKVQTYMACGRSIIGCLDGEGARVIEESGAGISSPADNPQALSEAVLKMYNLSEEERTKMGLQGREYFEKHFKRDILLSQLEKWIADLI